MKFVVSTVEYKQVKNLQQMFDVTIISNKGLVFMYRDDWQKICGYISEFDEAIYNKDVALAQSNPLLHHLNLWSECFLVVYDESEDYSAHAICNFDLFNRLCRIANISCVLVPYVYDITDYVTKLNAHNNQEALGCYIESRGDQIIEVEDN